MKNRRIIIKCKCGNELYLKLIGGQYQYSYRENCACGRDWLLEDLSEDCDEDEDSER